MQYNPSRYEVDKKTGFFTIGYGAGSSPTFTNLTVTNNGTFGGNLTVSGTGLNVGGNAQTYAEVVVNAANGAGQGGYLSVKSLGVVKSAVGSKAGITGSGTSNNLLLKSFSDAIELDAATTTVSGNLTVSGTGNSSVAGTLLVATTINSSNGKLQLATHTTSAGGIGFGTDWSLYRVDQYSIGLNGTAGGSQLRFYESGTLKGLVGTSAGNSYFDSLSGSIIFRTNSGTTALTLDSSQLTFTASAAKIGSLTGTVDSRLHVYESTAVSDSNGLTLEQASTGDSLISFLLTGVQRWSVGIDNSDSDKFKIGTGNLGAADKFTVDTSGNATVAGSIAIGNTVQAAASVASTHKVTISIGGSTYYLLATNV